MWIACIAVLLLTQVEGQDESSFTVESTDVCSEPWVPANSNLECKVSPKNNNRFVCKATCSDGYFFPDGKNTKRHICNRKNGKWRPEYQFPDCVAICEPYCENGGKCVEGNICICPTNFRGHRCQYSVELCDPRSSFTVSADWKCNHTNENSICTVNCPIGTENESPPIDFYECTLGGVWTPHIGPNCKPINVIEVPSTHHMHYGVTDATKTVAEDAVCVTWNLMHYRTFDGGMYSFQGHCSYLFAKDCSDDTFAIHLKTNVGSVSVIIYIGEDVYTLSNQEYAFAVQYSGTTHLIPTSINGLLFELIGGFATLKSSLGFRLMWNGNSTVLLKVDSQLKNRTCGLCGRFDDSVLNDFEMPDGSITDTVDAFVNSWTMEDLADTCSKGATIADPCATTEKVKANDACEVIFDAKFAPCHSVLDPVPYHTTCKMDYCSCKNNNELCICESLAQYFFECRRLGVKLEQGWRNEKLCPFSCTNGMVYEDCGTSCPKTCKGTVYNCEDNECVEGCHCPPNTVLHNGECVVKDQCPCVHGGKEFKSGERTQQDCNACECLAGKWHCTEDKCKARCSSVANSHYTTFDGAKFESDHTCPVYLVYSGNFSVSKENILCSELSSRIEESSTWHTEYCTKTIAISYADSVVTLESGGRVLFNEKEVAIPYNEMGISVFVSSSEFTMVTLPNKLSVLYDGRNRVYIDAPPTLTDLTKGLCGTFNHNQNDDFLTPEGDLEADGNAFAERWKVSESCGQRSRRSEHTLCEMQPQKMGDAKALCSLLTSDLFKTCHAEVDPGSFYKNCIYDLCSCNSDVVQCLCSSLADYASACSLKGITIEWTNKITSCRPSCKGEQTYQECVNPCKLSCSAISLVNYCEEDSCVQGCACPEGMTLNDEGFCIPVDQCPCIYEEKEYAAKTFVVQGTDICECENAVWICHHQSLQEATSLSLGALVTDVEVTCLSEENQVYTPCVEECSMTCQNKYLPQKCKTKVCKPGCRCQDGYIMDSDLKKCIKESECGCRHGGHKYKEGESFKKNCNTCFCRSGIWECSEKICPGMCTVWGESHFKTYDGNIYDFHGDCEYVLSKGHTNEKSFEILVQNVPCGTSGVTCSKSFTLKINDYHQITLSKQKPIPKNAGESPFIVLESGLYVLIYTKAGVSVKWDKGTRIIVTLNPKWRGKVEGLCGNFNDDQIDDFQTPSGGLHEANLKLFADSWKIQEYCPEPQLIADTCSLHPSRSTWAHQKCKILKSSIFAPCHSEVALQPYYDRCIFDTCACDEGGDCECLCTAISAYVQECNIHGIHIRWRSQELCPIQCEECSVYESCMSPCPARTCESQFLLDVIQETCSAETCVEGCFPKPCPPGQIYNDSRHFKCIPIADCVVPCLEINGKMYNEGERITDPFVADACQSCHCLQGIVSCKGNPCPTVKPQFQKILAECRETGWTPWFNNPSAIGGDFELLEDALTVKKISAFCDITNVTDIECRTSDTKTPYKEAGQNVLCNIPEGLICSDAEQKFSACKDYEIRVFCDCGHPEVTALPTEIACTGTGWTAWMDANNPDGAGEMEAYSALRKLYTFCSDEEIEAVECRNKLTMEDPVAAHVPNVKCTIKDGLVCENSELHKCDDYEIRFYCKCPEECIPGWTAFFNVDNPQQNIDQDDDETIQNIRNYHSFCPNELITDVECKAVVDGKLVDYKETGEFGLKCSPRVGFICNSLLRQEKCLDYQIRFYCSCGVTTPMPSPTTTVFTTTNPCPPGEVYDDCAYECNQLCSAFLYQMVLNYKCTAAGDGGCIPSCRPVKGCTSPMLWRGYDSCVSKEECTCVIPEENGQLIYVAPNDVVIHNCEKCQCVEDTLKCHSIPLCGEVTVTSQPFLQTTETETQPPQTTITYPPENIETSSCWTEWVSSDSPDSGGGDFEDIASLRRKYEFCAQPVRIECRSVKDKKQASVTGQILDCSLETGLICWNSNNGPNGCFDYEVRFYCPCATTITSTTTLPPTTPTTMMPAPCVDGWTEWHNSHYPDTLGEYETVQSVRMNGGYFCANEMIAAAECRVKGSENHRNLQHGVTCELRTGLFCDNANRDREDLCYDYEIRFYCDCPKTTVPTTTTVTTTTTTQAIITSTKPALTRLLPCSYWSDWINDNHPSEAKKSIKGIKTISSGTGDVEKKMVWRLQQENGFCLEGVVSDIECRDALTGVDYTETGDVNLLCDVNKGFRCRGKNQRSHICRDYKIRYFCKCEEALTTIILRPTSPVPVVPQCTSYYEMVDGPNPLPDSSLKASTSLTLSSGPHSGRLSTTQGPNSAGAWIAKTLNSNQYIEVDLGHVTPVYGVITKGRDGAKEWVMSYHVLYGRDGSSFSYVMDESQPDLQKIFSGNYDGSSPVEHIFIHPFEARYVRIQPIAYMNEIAMRIGLLGCSEGMTTLPVTTPMIPVCVDEMGLQNGLITDSDIKFSTVYDATALPSSVRLMEEQKQDQPGGWVAGVLDNEQYVQIDLLDPRTITGVITQGRDLVPQWVTAFAIAYSKDGEFWNYILDKKGEMKVFPGNFDGDTPVKTFFQQPIRTRFVRIYPQKWNNWIALRLEILGCYEPYEIITPSESVLNALHTTTAPPYFPGVCGDPMGFENHQIPDGSVQVSSSALVWSGSSRIRLNQRADENGTGGWVAAPYDVMPFVVINFFDKRNLTGIITQGRDKASMWVTSYTVQYSTDNVTWNFCRDLVRNDFIFPGNKDSDSQEIRLFDEMITARFLKITVKSYHNTPALRLEILGCFQPYVTTTTISTTEMVTEPCVSYGPWLSTSHSVLRGDVEPMEKLIYFSGLCSNPVSIQCREIITHQDYKKTGQNVVCDLTHGFICNNNDQLNENCFNYEARIGCWSCETTPLPTTPLPLALCPETPTAFESSCPISCPHNYSCDGKSCIPHVDCPCFKEGKSFKAGDIHITKECERCDCILGGYSKCQPIKCPPCAEGQTSEMSKNCQCECKGCEFGTILCPSNGQCISEVLWCDGAVDCPDDETDCPTSPPTTTSTTTTTLKPTTISELKSCTLDGDLGISTCEMNINRFNTFDGSFYQYDICDHILMKEVAERFSVTVHKQCSEFNVNQCQRYLMIYMDEIEVRLGPGPEEVVFNGQKVPSSHLWLIGKRFRNFGIKKRSNQIVFVSYKYNFEVSWNSRQDAKIKVSKCMLHHLVGLCGLYNDVLIDDLTKSDNNLATSATDFGDSWSIGDLSRCSVLVCSAEILTHASEICVNLYKEPFSNCSTFFDLPTEVNICMELICECMESKNEVSLLQECKCEAYESLVDKCEEEKGGAVGEWRVTHNCIPDCPPGLEWQECGPGCDLTCDNYRERESICENKCVPGCYCSPGLIHHNNHCVKQELCQDCVCRGHGDPNYITFDNQYYAFQGNCTYILAQHLANKKPLDFQVLGINYECPEEPHTSCTAGVRVLWNGHVIEKFQYKPVYFDGISLGLNHSKYEKDGVFITYIPGKSTIIHIQPINLAVRYFDQMYAFNIELPAYLYFNKTEGLCGICNFDKSDDLYHRDGFVTDDIDDFAYSWLINNTRNSCIIPRVVTPSPPPGICNFTLNPCDMFIDPTLYSKSCQNDISYSHNPDASMCRSKFQYAQQCCEKGIALNDWLRESGCLTTCPEGMVYQCTSACEKTCDNFQQPDNCNLMPLLTCTCPDGQVFKDSQCINPTACVVEKQIAACIYEHTFEVKDGLQVPLSEAHYYEVKYELGSQWFDGLCRNCSCIEKDGQIVSYCLIERCLNPSELPDADDYAYQEEVVPYKCCPKSKRTHCLSQGVHYSDGEEWPSPDGNRCKTLRCVAHSDAGVIIVERNIICDKSCPAYAVYVEPEPGSPNCCGRCKPVACEEDGVIYPSEAKWASLTKPCFSAECVVTENMTTIVYTGKSCMPLQPNCPKDHIVMDEDGCCSTCNIPTETCEPIHIASSDTVHYFNILHEKHGSCTNLEPVLNLTKCSGQCESQYSYLPSHDDFESTCKCCLPKESKPRNIKLKCTDGYSMQKVYQAPMSCHCSSCGQSEEHPTIELPPPY